MRRMRAAVALLGFHEQDLVLGGVEHLDDLRHRRRIDPVLGIHEQPAARLDGGAGLVHLFHDALIHQRFRHVLADRLLVAAAPEIAGEGLLADHVFSRSDSLHDHRRVQIGRGADVDDVDVRVGDQVAKSPVGRRDAMFLGKIDDVVAARRNGFHLRREPVDALVGVHVQLGDKPAPDQAHSYFCHRHAPSPGAIARRRRA